MRFPNVRYISYSTCSIFMTENEYVVSKILNKHPEFKLVDIFTQIKELNFHTGITPETENTLRACRKCNCVDGFYVAIFEKNN
jgi:16S rRNA C967 or C1407 C5-methylase (RsmB/RsmF family)